MGAGENVSVLARELGVTQKAFIKGVIGIGWAAATLCSASVVVYRGGSVVRPRLAEKIELNLLLVDLGFKRRNSPLRPGQLLQ
jgi:hypothetical protein